MFKAGTATLWIHIILICASIFIRFFSIIKAKGLVNDLLK